MFPFGSRIWVCVPEGPATGLWLHLDPRYEQIYWHGNYEPAVQRVIAGHLRTGDVFYEIGAHIGFFSMIAARQVGEEGAVFAFEPDPENAARIKEHARRNGLTRIEVVQSAAWSDSGFVQFERASPFSSRNTGRIAGVVGSRTPAEVVEVEATTLDAFAAFHRPPALVKVDVEGTEAEVLRGGDRLFSQTRPLLLCEVHHREVAISVENWLGEKGYKFEWLTSGEDFPQHILAQPRRSITTLTR